MKLMRISEEDLRSGGGDNFVGEVHVQPLVSPGEGLDIVLVRFQPGARTYLHTHESPQVLHCISGRGILATESQRFEVGPGDVVYVTPGEVHWHGASAGSTFAHLSIRSPGETHWTKQDPLGE